MKGPIIFIIAFPSAILIFLVVVKIASLRKYKLITRKGTFKLIDRFLIGLSVMIILISVLWDFNYLQFTPSVPYKNWDLITLNDFKGLKKPSDNLDGEDKFAFVSTSISIKKTSDSIIIQALFHPCRSYVYNRKLYANGLLDHEMYHFHITEYCARLMRQDVVKNVSDNIPVYIGDLKLRHFTKENELQYQYDDETYHSYVHGKQLEWQKKVDSLLLSVEDFSNPVISLK